MRPRRLRRRERAAAYALLGTAGLALEPVDDLLRSVLVSGTH